MANWRARVTIDYNPSYAYGYGRVCQPGPEQNPANMINWEEAGVADLSNYNAGAAQGYYDAREEAPPSHSPEQHAANGHCHYQDSGVVYLNDAGRLLQGGQHQAPYDALAHEARRAGRDSTSDSDAHTSPESWSSGSSREGILPQADPATWAKKELQDEASARTAEASADVSNAVMEEPMTYAVIGNESINKTIPLHEPVAEPKRPSAAAANPKGKVRAAFSESQMNALVQRFSVQRYLTPAEMKNLADVTGLTYKQVKTWFQNRRMKLRRHQKDTSWVSERYATNKDNAIREALFTNVPPHIPHYQGEAPPNLKEHYNQHMMDAAFKKTTPQNLAFYLAAMGSAAGSSGYPSWSNGSPQTPMPTTPQAAGWPMTPGVGHYQYNPNAFNSTSMNPVNTRHDAGFDSKDGEPFHGLNAAIVHNASQ